MDLYLLRHGVSVSNEQSLVCGASDYPLSETGKLQAKQISNTLNSLKFSRIYCSPLVRARQTIEHLHHDIEVTVVHQLMELDTGEFSHITTDQLYTLDPRYRYQGMHPYLKYPAGECLNDMMLRVTGWFSQESKLWNESESILITGHEGTVCAILHHMLKLDVEHYPTFSIGNCDLVHITKNTDGQIRYRFHPFNFIVDANTQQ